MLILQIENPGKRTLFFYSGSLSEIDNILTQTGFKMEVVDGIRVWTMNQATASLIAPPHISTLGRDLL